MTAKRRPRCRSRAVGALCAAIPEEPAACYARTSGQNHLVDEQHVAALAGCGQAQGDAGTAGPGGDLLVAEPRRPEPRGRRFRPHLPGQRKTLGPQARCSAAEPVDAVVEDVHARLARIAADLARGAALRGHQLVEAVSTPMVLRRWWRAGRAASNSRRRRRSVGTLNSPPSANACAGLGNREGASGPASPASRWRRPFGTDGPAGVARHHPRAGCGRRAGRAALRKREGADGASRCFRDAPSRPACYCSSPAD